MRFVLAGLTLAICAVGGLALGAESSNEEGYRNCNLKHLTACQNSNQLFWGPWRFPRAAPRKRDFVDALNRFLRNAPPYVLFDHKFNAAQVARESLIGPGGDPVRLSKGELFFDGFTPHDAPDMGAVIFDKDGKILIIATLNPQSSSLSTFELRIYSHDSPPRTDLLDYLRGWAKEAIENRNTAYPNLEKEVLGDTRLLVASTKTGRWETRSAP